MARLGVTKKKKSPRATEVSQLKKELQRVTEQLESCKRELAEGIGRETATGEILRVIANSPTDIQPVLNAVAESAAQLCNSNDATILRVDGNLLRRVAHYGPVPVFGTGLPAISRGSPVGRAVLDRQTIHVHDIAAEIETEFPEAPFLHQHSGARTILATPLLREGIPIGVINIRRTEVRPFTDKQIALLKTFADQAVIAIENVRLFQELKESLEQQTATSEILGVIASSPTDLQPVLDTVAENAARLCEAADAVVYRVDGDWMQPVAIHGTLGASPLPCNRGSVTGRAVTDRQDIHVYQEITDLDTEFPESTSRERQRGLLTRTRLAVPLLREGEPLGAILIRRVESRPFTEKQIALLKTFADQAVIAIENVRLFNELQSRNRDLTEALEQQTATGEVLRVIASSPTELQPVLDTLLANAVKLSGAKQGHIRQSDGEFLRVVAHYNESPERIAVLQSIPLPLVDPNIPGVRALLDRKPIHVHDALLHAADAQFMARVQPQLGVRTLLAVPLLREGTAVGTITIWRDVVEPFTDRQIELVKTFADQAVIAIGNVRLFQELQSRNAELREALEHQTATAEVLGIISRSPTDVQPVLDAIVESAARVCGIDDVLLRLREGNYLVARAHFGPITITRAEISIDAPPFRWMREHGPLHIPDVREQNDFSGASIMGSWRTWLAVPLLQQGELIGHLSARRNEVRPFTPAQIKLLETFADQAVIAIENVRLFNELKESLEQQTATSEILGVIASSPTDLQPVLDVVAENAASLCEANDAVISRLDGNTLQVAARYGPIPPAGYAPFTRGNPAGRAMIDRTTIHVHDITAEFEMEFPESRFLQKRSGARTILATPLLREGTPIGVITIRRTEVRPFSEKQIALLKTFADQAVIAIENVRLFNQLKESLEQQTATSEILGVIASSPTDIQPVLDTVVGERRTGYVTRINDLHLTALMVTYPSTSRLFGTIPSGRWSRNSYRSWPSYLAELYWTRRTIHVP